MLILDVIPPLLRNIQFHLSEYIYMCVYVCMYMCVYARTHERTYVLQTYICTYVHTCVLKSDPLLCMGWYETAGNYTLEIAKLNTG